MSEEVRVYEKELGRFNYGHPLWWPEQTKGPNGSDHDVEIGDVGYVDDDGAFHALFNVTYDADHVLSAGRVLHNGFTPLRYNSTSVETKERFRTPENPIYSSSVTGQQIFGELAANSQATVVGGTLSFRFQCHSQQGAVLMMWDDATKTNIQRQQLQFERYMRDHQSEWYSYAKEVLGISCKPEQIILVRGFIKTSSWTVATFLGGSNHSREVTLHGQVGPIISVGFGYAHQNKLLASPMHQRSGPAHRIARRSESQPQSSISLCADQQEQKDQCVFLNYYKIKYRLPFHTKIKAAAYPKDTDGNDKSDDSIKQPVYDAEVVTECDLIESTNPLDILLEYILEFSNASIAIASYDDLEAFAIGDQWQDDLASLLRELSPKITVDDKSVGMLSSSDPAVIVTPGFQSVTQSNIASGTHNLTSGLDLPSENLAAASNKLITSSHSLELVPHISTSRVAIEVDREFKPQDPTLWESQLPTVSSSSVGCHRETMMSQGVQAFSHQSPVIANAPSSISAYRDEGILTMDPDIDFASTQHPTRAAWPQLSATSQANPTMTLMHSKSAPQYSPVHDNLSVSPSVTHYGGDTSYPDLPVSQYFTSTPVLRSSDSSGAGLSPGGNQDLLSSGTMPAHSDGNQSQFKQGSSSSGSNHQGGTLSCEICGSIGFRQLHELNRHKASVHSSRHDSSPVSPSVTRFEGYTFPDIPSFNSTPVLRLSDSSGAGLLLGGNQNMLASGAMPVHFDGKQLQLKQSPSGASDQHGWFLTCHICGAAPFKRPHELNRHKTSAHMPHGWTCQSCAKLFPRKDILERHTRTVHGEPDS